MTDEPAPETDAKLADDPRPPRDSPDYARALEIHIHLLRAELADARAKKSDALIAAVDDIERLTAERDDAAALAKNYAERMKRSDAELAAAQQTVARLREALELIATPMRPDGTYNRDRTACGYIAREALATSAK
jgi:hypothetical protein